MLLLEVRRVEASESILRVLNHDERAAIFLYGLDLAAACDPFEVRSYGSVDFAGLNDLREIALDEVQIRPDDSRSVALGRIKQID